MTLFRIENERGDANLLGLVLALPVLLLLFAIAFDWLREPLARQALRYALYHGVYHMVPNYDCGHGTGSSVCVTENKYHSIGVDIPNFTLDPSTPAGYSFCEASGLLWNQGLAVAGGIIPISESACKAHMPDLFSDGFGQAQSFGVAPGGAASNSYGYIEKMALLTLDYLTKGGSGFFNYEPGDVGVQFSLFRIPNMDPFTGLTGAGLLNIDELQFNRYAWPGDLDVESLFEVPLWGDDHTGGPGELIVKLRDQAIDPSNQYRLGWGVEPCSAHGADICQGRYFQSTWVAAVGYIKLHSLFGEWSLFGSSTGRPKENIISEYVFRPLNTYASLEVGS